MKKEELLAFGVPADKVRAFQAAYMKDLNKLAVKKRREEDENHETRAAIAAMLQMIKRRETLRRILLFINKEYFREV